MRGHYTQPWASTAPTLGTKTGGGRAPDLAGQEELPPGHQGKTEPKDTAAGVWACGRQPLQWPRKTCHLVFLPLHEPLPLTRGYTDPFLRTEQEKMIRSLFPGWVRKRPATVLDILSAQREGSFTAVRCTTERLGRQGSQGASDQQPYSPTSHEK